MFISKLSCNEFIDLLFQLNKMFVKNIFNKCLSISEHLQNLEV